MEIRMQNLLVTGGCGFIGANFIRHLLTTSGFDGRIVNVDALTYAGNPESLADPLLKATCEKWRGKANVGTLPPSYLKPYWFDVEGVESSEAIVISRNERRCIHPDAKTKTVRVRLDPLVLPYG